MLSGCHKNEVAETQNTEYNLEFVTGAHDQSRPTVSHLPALIAILMKYSSTELQAISLMYIMSCSEERERTERPQTRSRDCTVHCIVSIQNCCNCWLTEVFSCDTEIKSTVVEVISAHKRKQAKDEERLDGLYRKISARTMDVRTGAHN